MARYLVESNKTRLTHIEELLNQSGIRPSDSLTDADEYDRLVIYTNRASSCPSWYYCYGQYDFSDKGILVQQDEVETLILLIKMGLDDETIKKGIGVHING